jgi:LysR family nod box-dependent transcriptional activator
MRLKGLDLNQLICLDALLTEQNVSRVAKQLHLSQSAVSWILARLREHFDDQLLVPVGRSMAPTAFAEKLRDPVRDFILRAQAIEQRRPASEPEDFDCVIRLVASDATQSICLAEAIRNSTALAPKLRFDLLPVTERSSIDLKRGEIDLLCAGQGMVVDAPGEILFEDTFCCIAWAEADVFAMPLTMDRYLTMDHVTVKWGSLRATTNDAMAIVEEGLTRRESVTASQFASIPELLMGTGKIATVPSLLADNMAKRWPLAIDSCPLELEPVRVRAYWRSTLESDSALMWFRSILSEVAAEISRHPHRSRSGQ